MVGSSTMTQPELGQAWAAGRPAARVTHLDSAACSRTSTAVQARVAEHLRAESELGGYLAQARAGEELDAARAALGGLLGAPSVVFVQSALDAVALLLRALGLPLGARVLVTPGEYGPNLVLLRALGLVVEQAPVADAVGHVDVPALAAQLAADPPALVHLCPLGSHRGVAQPLAGVVAACRAAGVPVVVDAAQALGHLDCAVPADAVYATSRKWLAGPRGVGVLAVSDGLAARLDRPVAGLEAAEGFVAGRLGLGVAVAEHLALGPAAVRAGLAAVGARTRAALDGVGGWRVVEPADEPTATTTLAPPPGWDDAGVAALRERLLADGVVTTYAGPERAPLEARAATLRVSPHLDVTDADLARLAAALT